MAYTAFETTRRRNGTGFRGRKNARGQSRTRGRYRSPGNVRHTFGFRRGRQSFSPGALSVRRETRLERRRTNCARFRPPSGRRSRKRLPEGIETRRSFRVPCIVVVISAQSTRTRVTVAQKATGKKSFGPQNPRIRATCTPPIVPPAPDEHRRVFKICNQ